MGTDLYSTGGFTQLYDATQWDLTGEESNVVGNATAIGVSAGGTGTSQLQALKTRMQTTKAAIQAQNFAGLTGEQVSGDLLAGAIWSWFAAAESHNRLSQNQAGMVENTGLSYGLFHSTANPIYSWGVIRQVTFPGLNLDIGHIRNVSWSKANLQADWVNYNVLRGHYMSGLEALILDNIFDDPAQCNPAGSATLNPALPACSVGVSAVRAQAIAAQQGQRIYDILPDTYAANPGIVSTALYAHSDTTKDKIQQALDAGYEVKIHERPIAQDTWTGAGFTMIDPGTGDGGYLVDGGSNGGLKIAKGILTGLGIALFVTGTSGVAASLLLIITILTVFVAFYSLLINAIEILDTGGQCSGLLAKRYLESMVPVTVVATLLSLFGGSKTVEALMIKMVGMMYGADLFKGVGSSTACQ